LKDLNSIEEIVQLLLIGATLPKPFAPTVWAMRGELISVTVEANNDGGSAPLTWTGYLKGFEVFEFGEVAFRDGHEGLFLFLGFGEGGFRRRQYLRHSSLETLKRRLILANL